MTLKIFRSNYYNKYLYLSVILSFITILDCLAEAEDDFKPLCVEKISSELNSQRVDGNILTLFRVLPFYTEGVRRLAPAIIETELRKIKEGGIGETSLYCAILGKDEKEIIELLARGADPNFVFNGHTPLLHKAVFLNSLPLVKKVLEMGVPISTKDSRGNSAQAIAASFGRFKILSYLIQQGADYRERNVSGEGLLHLAVSYSKMAGESYEEQDLKTIKVLHHVGIDPNSTNLKGQTPLHYAIMRHQPPYSDSRKIVPMLVKIGANINQKDNKGYGLLHYFSNGGGEKYKEIVELLTENGSDLELRDNQGMTPFLLKVFKKSFKEAKDLIELGVDINAKDNNGRTALHYATKYSNLELIKLLRTRGLDSNAVDVNGESAISFGIDSANQEDILLNLLKNHTKLTTKPGDGPLHYVARSGWLKVAKYLIDEGEDVNLTLKQGSPLHVAVLASGPNKLKMVELLVENGANLEVVNFRENTPLFSACYHSRDPKIIEYLLKKGAKPDVGKSSLLELMIRLDGDIARILINNGANIDVLNDSGDTLLHVVALAGDTSIGKLLLEKGLDPHKVDILGHTALYYAKTKNKMDLVTLLKSYGAKE